MNTFVDRLRREDSRDLSTTEDDISSDHYITSNQTLARSATIDSLGQESLTGDSQSQVTGEPMSLKSDVTGQMVSDMTGEDVSQKSDVTGDSLIASDQSSQSILTATQLMSDFSSNQVRLDWKYLENLILISINNKIFAHVLGN